MHQARADEHVVYTAQNQQLLLKLLTKVSKDFM